MTSERLLHMSIEVLYLTPKKFIPPPKKKQIYGYVPPSDTTDIMGYTMVEI